MLEQEGFVKSLPRRGIIVVRRSKAEIVDMIRAWAALESMAARLITTTARKRDITALRDFFKDFNLTDRLPQDHVEEYSKANIAFHQALLPQRTCQTRGQNLSRQHVARVVVEVLGSPGTQKVRRQDQVTVDLLCA